MWSCRFSHLQPWNAVSLILLMFSVLISLLICGYSFYKCIFCNGIGQKKISRYWRIFPSYLLWFIVHEVLICKYFSSLGRLLQGTYYQSLQVSDWHLNSAAVCQRHLWANMASMLVGLKLSFSLLNYLLKRPSYQHIFGVPKKRNLQRLRMAKCAEVIETMYFFSFGKNIEAIIDNFQSILASLMAIT